MKYEPVIGLEIHVQLNTKTKMFCDSLNDPEETRSNVNVCPICLAHPGTLPVINREAVRKVIKVGLALGANIREKSWFERKNYFYPDLPKGYQISQYEAPLCEEGELELSSGKKIRIRRVHLEEDTGRLLHDPKGEVSLVDFNRAGVPLMELVTEPDLASAAETKEFGQELQLLFQYLNVSGADMEKGQMRLEANVSVRPEGSSELGTKVELKNINSFRAVERAITYEIKRQTELLEKDQKVIQGTRGWDEDKGETFEQRTKEEAQDYRYFPEPDLPPLRFKPQEIEEIRRSLPELPQERRARFQKEYNVTAEQARIFTMSEELGNFYEKVVSELGAGAGDQEPETGNKVRKLAANYLITEVQKLVISHRLLVTDLKITPENFAELMVMIVKGTVSSSGAQEILAEMVATGGDPSQILEEKGLAQVSDEAELEKAAREVITANPKAVADYKKGKETSLTFLVGQLMRQTKGSANPQIAAEILKKLLSEKLTD